jgi:hypothetical protein
LVDVCQVELSQVELSQVELSQVELSQVELSSAFDKLFERSSMHDLATRNCLNAVCRHLSFGIHAWAFHSEVSHAFLLRSGRGLHLT